MTINEYPPHPYEPTHTESPSIQGNLSALNRRKFFKLAGSGLAVVFVLQDLLSIAGSTNTSTTVLPASQVGAWLHIGEDGIVSVFTGKVEVGQNIRTSLSQVVAEELQVPFSSIKMIMGDTDLVPYDAGTFGSRTMPQMGTQLRKASATARAALIDMAAKNWKVDAGSLQADQGFVYDANLNRKISYAQLTQGKQLLLQIADDVKIKPATEWKISGKTVLKVNGSSFITGKHRYVSDMKIPGMLHGKVLRAP
ncbi:MAG: molybdopterin cofactor-binding domain-containing protein [Chitinophagaceae bacterium]